MRSNHLLVLVVTGLVVSGCSGGDNGPPGRDPQTSAPPVLQPACPGGITDPVPVLQCDSLPTAPPSDGIDALPGGYWQGLFIDETQAVHGYMHALVSEDGRFHLQASRDMCFGWEAALTGRMTTTGNAMNASGRMIAQVPTLVDGTRAADLEIDGVVLERTSISGRWTASSGDAGCFLMDSYDAGYYEAPSTLENLVGEWTDHYSPTRARLAVDANGNLAGADRNGCEWTGRFGLIDDRYSLYEFEADLQSCDQAGHYTGLTWHGDGWDYGEYWLWLRANDGEHALVLTFSSK